MNAIRASINRGLVQGQLPFWTSFLGALPTISPPNHVSPPNHHVLQTKNHHVLHPPSLLPLQKCQGPRNNGGHYSTLCAIVAGSVFAAGVNLIAPDAPDATLYMAKKSKTNKNQQSSGAKGGKHVKGALVLNFPDPADPLTTLGECLLVRGSMRMVRLRN